MNVLPSAYVIPGLKVVHINADFIVKSVCDYYHVEKEEVYKKHRTLGSKPRKVAMYFIRKELDMSLNQIAAFFGLKNHTSIMYNIELVDGLLSAKHDNDFKRDIPAIGKMFHR